MGNWEKACVRHAYEAMTFMIVKSKQMGLLTLERTCSEPDGPVLRVCHKLGFYGRWGVRLSQYRHANHASLAKLCCSDKTRFHTAHVSSIQLYHITSTCPTFLQTRQPWQWPPRALSLVLVHTLPYVVLIL